MSILHQRQIFRAAFLRRVLLSNALLLTFGSFAIGQTGVKFETGTWSEVLAKAKSSNRLIFMDAYTVWCGPCKMMAKETFTNADAADFFNKNFVNVKMDMEKGEGIQLAEQYNVRAYPTLLFIDGDGKVAHLGLGYHDPARFIALGQTALDPARTIVSLDKRYAAGERSAGFMVEYLEAKGNAGAENVGQIAAEYLEQQSDLSSEANMMMVMQYIDDVDSKAFTHLLDNRAKYEAKFGAEDVESKLQIVLATAVQSGKVSQGADLDKLIRKLFPEKGDEMISKYNMEMSLASDKPDDFAKAAIDHYTRFPSKNSLELNQAAWHFYENYDNKDYLRAALKWAEQSVALEEKYYNRDTVAALYYKLGKKKDGKKNALRAIELAKESGEDYSGTTELMKQWEPKKG
jgi:thiol-disulfide isomerase/thioredoxin